MTIGRQHRSGLAILKFDACFSGYSGLARLRPSDRELVHRDQLYYLLQSDEERIVAYQFHVRANGVTRYGLTHNGIQSVCLPLPPHLPEQTAIVEYLDKATADIDTAVARARRQIELVQEYRTRLIADVVTGKLDVREAAAQLPDESDEEEPDRRRDSLWRTMMWTAPLPRGGARQWKAR